MIGHHSSSRLPYMSVSTNATQTMEKKAGKEVDNDQVHHIILSNDIGRSQSIIITRLHCTRIRNSMMPLGLLRERSFQRNFQHGVNVTSYHADSPQDHDSHCSFSASTMSAHRSYIESHFGVIHMRWGKAYNNRKASLTVRIQLHDLEFILGAHTIILNILDWYCIELQDWYHHTSL